MYLQNLIVFILRCLIYSTHAFCLTVSESLSKINLSVNQEYGYLSFSIGKLLSLPPVVIRKILQSLTMHISGMPRALSFRGFAWIHKKLHNRERNISRFENCILFFPDLDYDTVMMGKAMPRETWKDKTLISVGQTILWDRRWRITLKPLKKLDRQDSRKASDGGEEKKEQLYVSHMKIEEYWGEDKQDNRRVPASILPDNKLWSGLPVICTESGHVVLAPHFKIIDHSYSVDCDVTFDPLMPLLQDSDTHIVLQYQSY